MNPSCFIEKFHTFYHSVWYFKLLMKWNGEPDVSKRILSFSPRLFRLFSWSISIAYPWCCIGESRAWQAGSKWVRSLFPQAQKYRLTTHLFTNSHRWNEVAKMKSSVAHRYRLILQPLFLPSQLPWVKWVRNSLPAWPKIYRLTLQPLFLPVPTAV